MITGGLVLLICGILLGSAPLTWIGLVICVIGLSLLIFGIHTPHWW